MIFVRNLSLVFAVFLMGLFCSDGGRTPDKNYCAAALGELDILHGAYTGGDYTRSFVLAKNFADKFPRSAYLPSAAWIGIKSGLVTGQDHSFFREALRKFEGHGQKQVLGYAPDEDRKREPSGAKDAEYVFVDLPGVAAQRDYLIENNVVSAKDCALVEAGDEMRNLLRYPRELLKDFMGPLAGLGNGSICFYGSGNYHHLAYYLIKSFQRDITVVVFDAHTDYRRGSDEIFDCGSWVRAIMEQKNVKKVILAGINTDKKWFYENNAFRFPEDALILQQGDARSVYTGKFRRLRLENMESPLVIPTKDVYISVDMDLLAEAHATTDWGNGKVSLDQVASIIESIKRDHRIVGSDICALTELPDAKSLESLGRIVQAIVGSGLDIRQK
ncbi:MAG: arginase family protein [Elusimicrobiota bacterium]|nr:arginase family protein [Elusimicrobiota bacterium]